MKTEKLTFTEWYLNDFKSSLKSKKAFVKRLQKEENIILKEIKNELPEKIKLANETEKLTSKMFVYNLEVQSIEILNALKREFIK